MVNELTNVQYKFCQWLDSNRWPLELEATALPAEPQPLPKVLNNKKCLMQIIYVFQKIMNNFWLDEPILMKL